MKFGGTSMGSAERIKIAAGISAEHARSRSVIVVVSAMSKVTDLLLNTLKLAEEGNGTRVEANIQDLQTRHVETCRELLPHARCAAAICEIDDLIADFGRIARGILMLGERPPKSVDEAIAIGEKLSAFL